MGRVKRVMHIDLLGSDEDELFRTMPVKGSDVDNDYADDDNATLEQVFKMKKRKRQQSGEFKSRSESYCDEDDDDPSDVEVHHGKKKGLQKKMGKKQRIGSSEANSGSDGDYDDGDDDDRLFLLSSTAEESLDDGEDDDGEDDPLDADFRVAAYVLRKKFSKKKRKRGRPVSNESTAMCHWCRQKSAESHLKCSLCINKFCGTCLRNRHGEIIKHELRSNAKWVCPVCRGGCGPGCKNCCNCGPCRKAQNLPPTGILIHKARIAGFTNVHDFLIHLKTRESAEVIARRKIGRGWNSGSEPVNIRPMWGKKGPRKARKKGGKWYCHFLISTERQEDTMPCEKTRTNDPTLATTRIESEEQDSCSGHTRAGEICRNATELDGVREERAETEMGSVIKEIEGTETKLGIEIEGIKTMSADALDCQTSSTSDQSESSPSKTMKVPKRKRSARNSPPDTEEQLVDEEQDNGEQRKNGSNSHGRIRELVVHLSQCRGESVSTSLAVSTPPRGELGSALPDPSSGEGESILLEVSASPRPRIGNTLLEVSSSPRGAAGSISLGPCTPAVNLVQPRLREEIGSGELESTVNAMKIGNTPVGGVDGSSLLRGEGKSTTHREERRSTPLGDEFESTIAAVHIGSTQVGGVDGSSLLRGEGGSSIPRGDGDTSPITDEDEETKSRGKNGGFRIRELTKTLNRVDSGSIPVTGDGATNSLRNEGGSFPFRGKAGVTILQGEIGTTPVRGPGASTSPGARQGSTLRREEGGSSPRKREGGSIIFTGESISTPIRGAGAADSLGTNNGSLIPREENGSSPAKGGGGSIVLGVENGSSEVRGNSRATSVGGEGGTTIPRGESGNSFPRVEVGSTSLRPENQGRKLLPDLNCSPSSSDEDDVIILSVPVTRSPQHVPVPLLSKHYSPAEVICNPPVGAPLRISSLDCGHSSSDEVIITGSTKPIKSQGQRLAEFRTFLGLPPLPPSHLSSLPQNDLPKLADVTISNVQQVPLPAVAAAVTVRVEEKIPSTTKASVPNEFGVGLWSADTRISSVTHRPTCFNPLFKIDHTTDDVEDVPRSSPPSTVAAVTSSPVIEEGHLSPEVPVVTTRVESKVPRPKKARVPGKPEERAVTTRVEGKVPPPTKATVPEEHFLWSAGTQISTVTHRPTCFNPLFTIDDTGDGVEVPTPLPPPAVAAVISSPVVEEGTPEIPAVTIRVEINVPPSVKTRVPNRPGPPAVTTRVEEKVPPPRKATVPDEHFLWSAGTQISTVTHRQACFNPLFKSGDTRDCVEEVPRPSLPPSVAGVTSSPVLEKGLSPAVPAVTTRVQRKRGRPPRPRAPNKPETPAVTTREMPLPTNATVPDKLLSSSAGTRICSVTNRPDCIKPQLANDNASHVVGEVPPRLEAAGISSPIEEERRPSSGAAAVTSRVEQEVPHLMQRANDIPPGFGLWSAGTEIDAVTQRPVIFGRFQSSSQVTAAQPKAQKPVQANANGRIPAVSNSPHAIEGKSQAGVHAAESGGSRLLGPPLRETKAHTFRTPEWPKRLTDMGPIPPNRTEKEEGFLLNSLPLSKETFRLLTKPRIRPEDAIVRTSAPVSRETGGATIGTGTCASRETGAEAFWGDTLPRGAAFWASNTVPRIEPEGATGRTSNLIREPEGAPFRSLSLTTENVSTTNRTSTLLTRQHGAVTITTSLARKTTIAITTPPFARNEIESAAIGTPTLARKGTESSTMRTSSLARESGAASIVTPAPAGKETTGSTMTASTLARRESEAASIVTGTLARKETAGSTMRTSTLARRESGAASIMTPVPARKETTGSTMTTSTLARRESEDASIIRPSTFRTELDLLLQRPFSERQLAGMSSWVVKWGASKEIRAKYCRGLREKLSTSRSVEETLHVLRGFFFWLKHSKDWGAFRPWVTDETEDYRTDDLSTSAAEFESIDRLLADMSITSSGGRS